MMPIARIVLGGACACAFAGLAPPPPARAALPVGVMSERRLLAPGDHVRRVDGVRIAYHVAGTGPLLIVLSPDWGIGSGYLRAGLQPLERYRTVVFVDERGSGGSERPADSRAMGYHDMAGDLEALRIAWGLTRMDVLGHSAGATIAMDYAATHPGRVRKLLLVDAELPGLDVSAPRSRFKERWSHDPAHAEALRHYDDPMPKTDAGFSLYLRRTIAWYFSDPSRNAGPFAAAIPPTLPAWTLAASSRADQLQTSRAPIALERIAGALTLIVVGRDDAECPVEMADAIGTRIPRSKLVVLERSGHFPWIEARRAFLSTVRSFLANSAPMSAPRG